MRLPLYQVDAFAERLFTGNPAAVVVTPEALPQLVMQAIAAENNLSETAFVFGNLETLDNLTIRWFTPTTEVDLCGHATLAAAHILLSAYAPTQAQVQFNSHSGQLRVAATDGWLWLDFPCDTLQPANKLQEAVSQALGLPVERVLRGRTDLLAILSSPGVVKQLQPNLAQVEQLDCRGLIVSAQGDDTDFVSRFFTPQSGIDEDPVTGSAHITLVPYWSEILGKSVLTATQLSPRGGNLRCRLNGDRVHIGGKALTYLTGEINLQSLSKC